MLTIKFCFLLTQQSKKQIKTCVWILYIALQWSAVINDDCSLVLEKLTTRFIHWTLTAAVYHWLYHIFSLFPVQTVTTHLSALWRESHVATVFLHRPCTYVLPSAEKNWLDKGGHPAIEMCRSFVSCQNRQKVLCEERAKCISYKTPCTGANKTQ